MIKLCSSGVCRKVKLNYFLLGHGHCDGDGEISQGGTAIANADLPTFERFREEMKTCYEGANKAFADVERCVIFKSYFLTHHRI